MRFQGSESSEELAYIDVLAREWASEACIRCSGLVGWKTAALIYGGLEWRYYYCYECRRWFRRHFRFKYAVALVDDANVISMLLKQLEPRKITLGAQFESASWFRRKISTASRFFQRFLP